MPLLDLAVKTYLELDHVYAETMTAYAHVVRGYLAEREGDTVAAERDFTAGCKIAESHDHRLGIGSHWLKCRLGLARIAYRSGDSARSAQLVDEAVGMRAARTRCASLSREQHRW
ncbi:MAG: hypothetical protein ABIP09_02695 [Gemmatimonadaceae bacterium]